MKEELFINNERVDLGTDTKITLNFKSNLMGDISKIVSSNSYTINLPKTVRNRRILDNPSAPAHKSVILRKYSNVRYMKNGVEIINNGSAVLLSGSETYEIALTWGVMSGVQDWINDAKKLNELDDIGEGLLYDTGANISLAPYKYSMGYLYSRYNSSLTYTTELAALNYPHPSVRVKWILQKIQDQYGFVLDYPVDSKINDLMIPLVKKNGGKVDYDNSYIKISIYGSFNDQAYLYSYSPSSNPYFYSNKNGVIGLRPKVNGTLTIKPNFASSHKFSINTTDGYVEMPYTLVEGFYKYLYNIEMTVKVSADVIIEPSKISDGTINYNNSGIPKYIEYYIIPDEIIAGMQYPIAPNLPTIKQVDFLKAICAMYGLFPITDPGNTKLIKLIKIDTIISNKTKAIDWSSKLVPNDQNGEPKKIVYTFNDYSRINWMRYKEDDNVDVDADGSLAVDNETLDRENDLLTIPFAPSEGSIIDFYSISDDKTTLEDVTVQDRIMYEVNGYDGKSALSFSGLDFKTLIANNYVAYQKIIRSPVVITDIFRLNEIDLKEIDYTIPVYVKQYGRYYGIIKIQAGSDDLCECDLLQL